MVIKTRYRDTFVYKDSLLVMSNPSVFYFCWEVHYLFHAATIYKISRLVVSDTGSY